MYGLKKHERKLEHKFIIIKTTKENDAMITMRPWHLTEDYLQMKSLIRENLRLTGKQLYPTAMDLDYWRFVYDESPDGIQAVQLWQDETGHVVGFVWMNEDATDLVCHVNHTDLLDEMLEWSEKERIKVYADQNDEPVYNCINIFDCDHPGEEIARKRGYYRTDDFSYYGKRSLVDRLPEVCLPEGYTLQSISGDHEIEQRAAMNTLAGNEITLQKYKTMMTEAPNYRQELDLIALDPDRNVAGYCTVWYDELSHIGIFEPYAVHPDHLRKGLGRNLLYEGMNRLKALGAKAVYVSHGGLDSEETDPALELNAAVGFEQVGRNNLWVKRL